MRQDVVAARSEGALRLQLVFRERISAPPSATAAGSPETRVAVAVGQRGRHDSSRAGVALVSKSEAMDIPRDERPDAR